MRRGCSSQLFLEFLNIEVKLVLVTGNRCTKEDLGDLEKEGGGGQGSLVASSCIPLI